MRGKERARRRMELPAGYRAFRGPWTFAAAYWHLRFARGVAWDEPSAGRTIRRSTVLGFMHAEKLRAWERHQARSLPPVSVAGLDYQDAMRVIHEAGQLLEEYF